LIFLRQYKTFIIFKYL